MKIVFALVLALAASCARRAVATPPEVDVVSDAGAWLTVPDFVGGTERVFATREELLGFGLHVKAVRDADRLKDGGP